MTRLQKAWIFFKEVNIKTIRFNFRYFPFRQAIRLPVFVSRYMYVEEAGGKIVLAGPIRTRMIRLGYRVVGIFDHKRSRSIWQVTGTIIFEGRALIGQGSKIAARNSGTIRFGDNFVMTAESTLVADQKTISFGRNCLVSWDTLIMDTDYHAITDDTGRQINPPEDITIGEHVWIGCRCLVLKGAGIPSGAIVAANSLVTRKLSGENKLFGGQPAAELKSNVRWE